MRENWRTNWKDYYEILQVQPSAEQEVIKGAYEKLARKYHPDVNKAPTANERMKIINEAYECLSVPDKKSEYDRAYKTKNSGTRKASGNPSSLIFGVMCPKCEETYELDYGFSNAYHCPTCQTVFEYKIGVLQAKQFESSRSQDYSPWDFSIRIKDLATSEYEIIEFTSIYRLRGVEWRVNDIIALSYYNSKPTILSNLSTGQPYRIAEIQEPKAQQKTTQKGCGFWVGVVLLSIGSLIMISAFGSKSGAVWVVSIVLIAIGIILLRRRNKAKD